LKVGAAIAAALAFLALGPAGAFAMWLLLWQAYAGQLPAPLLALVSWLPQMLVVTLVVVLAVAGVMLAVNLPRILVLEMRANDTARALRHLSASLGALERRMMAADRERERADPHNQEGEVRRTD